MRDFIEDMIQRYNTLDHMVQIMLNCALFTTVLGFLATYLFFRGLRPFSRYVLFLLFGGTVAWVFAWDPMQREGNMSKIGFATIFVLTEMLAYIQARFWNREQVRAETEPGYRGHASPHKPRYLRQPPQRR